jgi:hypothetical protein
MKNYYSKILFLGSVFFFVFKSFSVFGNDSGDTIIVKSNFLSGLNYYKEGKRLKGYEVTSVLINHPEALRLYEKGKTNNIIAGVFGFASGLALARLITAKDLSDEGKTQGYVITGGLFLSGLLIQNKANGQIRKGANLYNQSLKSKPLSLKEIKLGISTGGTGIGLTFGF